MLLEIKDLCSNYGRIEALRNICLKIGEGEIITLIGANGAGKSTLLNVISGIQPATQGRLTFRGADITSQPSHRRVVMGIAQVPEGRQVFGPMSIEDNLRLGAYIRKRHDIKAALESCYDMFPKLAERAKQAAGTLSGGEQQMLAIGRALMAAPCLLLLDEPSMGLAPLITQQILKSIANLKDSGITVFLVEQDAYSALSIADRGYVMESGTITLSGNSLDLLHNTNVISAYLGPG